MSAVIAPAKYASGSGLLRSWDPKYHFQASHPCKHRSGNKLVQIVVDSSLLRLVRSPVLWRYDVDGAI